MDPEGPMASASCLGDVGLCVWGTLMSARRNRDFRGGVLVRGFGPPPTCPRGASPTAAAPAVLPRDCRQNLLIVKPKKKKKKKAT